MSVRGLRQIYKYGDEDLSITDLLKKKMKFLIFWKKVKD